MKVALVGATVREGRGPLKPVRPTVPCQMVREYVYVFAAVCASLGCLTTLILPMANTRE
jgi:hypothetical protein